MLAFLSLLSVVGLVLIAMAPEARERIRVAVLASLSQVRQEGNRRRPDIEEFRGALRERDAPGPIGVD